VADHEPAQALFAGSDGLAVIRRLLDRAHDLSARSSAVEHGMGQAEAVARIATENGYGDVEHLQDLAGIERVVVARR
jgi:release factor glutamine methyltransferase